jgi:hypothetical protein
MNKDIDEMTIAIDEMLFTDPLVHRVMTKAHVTGMSAATAYTMLAYYALIDLQAVRAELLRMKRDAPPAPILIHTSEAKELAELVVVWWANTKTGSWQRDPDCVTTAKKILDLR